MFSHFIRQILPILCVACSITGWCCSDICAQLADTRNRSNRHDREIRTDQQMNPARAMMQEMRASLKKIPWNELSPAAQTKIKSIVSDVPLFHRLPQQMVYADPEIYNFLLQHPDVVIGFWEHLGATQLSLREIRENHFILKETAGTVAAVEVLYRTNDLCIIYAKGEYLGPLLAKPYSGDVLLILRTQFTRDSMNEPMVICDLDSFVQINSLGADVLAKLFFASLTKTADSNFAVTVSFVGQVSRAASRNSAGLKGSAEEISSIRQEVCEEFCDVVDRSAMRFARRNLPIPLASKPRQVPMPVGLPIPIEEVQVKHNHDLLLSLSKPPAEWRMDHLHNSQPFFDEEVRDKNDDKLSTPEVIESNGTKNRVPKLPKPEK